MAFNLPFGVYIAGKDPVDSGRYLADNIAARNKIITEGRDHLGLQVYVVSEKKLYLLEGTTNNDWKEFTLDASWEAIIGDQKSVNLSGFNDGSGKAMVNVNVHRPFPSIGITDMAFGAGRFVAISFAVSNGIVSSVDGITWTRHSLTDSNLHTIIFDKEMFIAVPKVPLSGQDTSGSNIFKSLDGISWSKHSIVKNNWNDITYGNGVFVVVAENSDINNVMVSSDGETWNYFSIPAKIYSVTFDGNSFVAVSNSKVFKSYNGEIWTELSTLPFSVYIPHILFGNGTYVIAGLDKNISTLSSKDGINWVYGFPPKNKVWTNFSFANGIFFLTMHFMYSYIPQVISYSIDGISWESTEVELGIFRSGVCYGNNTYVTINSEPYSYSSITFDMAESSRYENIVNEYRFNNSGIIPKNKILNVPIYSFTSKEIIVDTYPGTADKVGYSTNNVINEDGNYIYIPKKGDRIDVKFTQGTTPDINTIEIDGQVFDIRFVDGSPLTSSRKVVDNVRVNTVIPMFYTGNFFSPYGIIVPASSQSGNELLLKEGIDITNRTWSAENLSKVLKKDTDTFELTNATESIIIGDINKAYTVLFDCTLNNYWCSVQIPSTNEGIVVRLKKEGSFIDSLGSNILISAYNSIDNPPVITSPLLFKGDRIVANIFQADPTDTGKNLTLHLEFTKK